MHSLRRQPEARHEYSQARRVRGPDALEYVAVTFISLIVIVCALPYLQHQVHMTQTTEAIALSQGPKIDMIVQRALYGDWPAPSTTTLQHPSNLLSSYHVRKISLMPDATVDMTLSSTPPLENHTSLPALTVSFRPALLGAAGAQSVIFLCGHAAPPPGTTTVFGSNRTTVPSNDLPPACRASQGHRP